MITADSRLSRFVVQGRKDGKKEFRMKTAFLQRLLSHLAIYSVLSEASPNVFQLSYLSAPRNLPLPTCPPFSVCSLRQSGEYIPCRSSLGEGERGSRETQKGKMRTERSTARFYPAIQERPRTRGERDGLICDGSHRASETRDLNQ